MRSSLRVLLLGLVVGPALVLAGPASPGMATITTVPPAPIIWPSSMLTSIGATAPTITTAASSAASGSVISSSVAVTSTGAAATGAAAGTAAVGAVPTGALVVGAAAIGWSAGRFLGTAACAGGVETVCWPTEDDPDFVPNMGVAVGTEGWVPTQTQSRTATGFGTIADGISIQITSDLTDDLAYLAPTPETLTVRLQWQDVWTQAGTSSPGWGNATVYREQRTYCRPSGGGAASVNGTSSGNITLNLDSPAGYTGPGTNTSTTGCTAGTVFDHLRIQLWKASADASNQTLDVEWNWYPEGHVSRPEDPDQNPDRTWLTKGQCVKGASVEFVQEESAVFADLDANVPKFPDVTCPDGYALQRLEVRKLTPTLASPDDDVLVWEWDYPLEEGDQHPAVKWEECSYGTCVLRLWKVQPDTSLLDCFDAPASCRAWWENRLDDPATYQCKYGSHVVALTECYVYRPTFETATKLATGTKTAADPDYANPDGSLTTDPLPDTDPGASQCPPDAGFLAFLNPFWLFDTLKCALVPTQAGLQAEWDNAGVDWCATAPGVLSCATGDFVAPLADMGDDSSGCLGGPIEVPKIGMLSETAGDITWYPFQACDPPASTISTFWLGFSSAVIYFGAFLAGAQMLAKTIGAGDAVPA